MENTIIENPQASFCFKFSLKGDKSREFEIRPLKQEHFDAVVDQTCKSFVEREPLGVFLGTTDEMWRPCIIGVAKRSIEENMGVICFDCKTGDIAVTGMCYDVYNDLVKPVYPKSEYREMQYIDDVLTLLEVDDSLEITQPSDAVELFALASSDGYQGLGLAKETVIWLLNNHPIISKAKVITTAASNPATRAIMEKAGGKTRKTINLLEYKNNEGEAVFSGITEVIEKKLSLKDYKEVSYCIYTHK